MFVQEPDWSLEHLLSTINTFGSTVYQYCITIYNNRMLSPMGLVDSPLCPFCQKYLPDTHLHAFWFCPIIENYWKKTFSQTSSILQFLHPQSLCILHYFDDDVPCVFAIPKDKKLFLLISLTIFKKSDTVKTRSNVPTIHWLSLLSDLASLERSTFKQNNNWRTLTQSGNHSYTTFPQATPDKIKYGTSFLSRSVPFCPVFSSLVISCFVLFWLLPYF